MPMLEKVLNKMNGLHYRQDYLCIANETFQQPLQVYLVSNGRVMKEISSLHCFVGYSPLIFALPLAALDGLEPGQIQIIFTTSSLEQNEVFTQKDALAMLWMKKIQITQMQGSICYYEGIKAIHRFVSGFYQSIMQASNEMYGRKPGNVFLSSNLYKQVQVAYSVPRKVCLITVKQDDLYNLFPTDLHGQPAPGFYIVSLRSDGLACKQVEGSGKILLSDMEAGSYKKVYALGKNHMQPLKQRPSFDFSGKESGTFGIPLPSSAISYQEMELFEAFIHGIHKILLFRIVNQVELQEKPLTLFHIHNCYATWRDHQGLPGNYLIR